MYRTLKEIKILFAKNWVEQLPDCLRDVWILPFKWQVFVSWAMVKVDLWAKHSLASTDELMANRYNRNTCSGVVCRSSYWTLRTPSTSWLFRGPWFQSCAYTAPGPSALTWTSSWNWRAMIEAPRGLTHRTRRDLNRQSSAHRILVSRVQKWPVWSHQEQQRN